MSKKPPTVTITARQFAQLVRGVLPHASKDRTLPLLNSLFFETSGAYLTATATDRYSLAVGRTRLEETPPAGFAAAISASDVRRITAWFKATRTADPTITLTLDGDRLTVASAGLVDLLEAHLVIQTVAGMTPNFLGQFKKIFRESATAEPAATFQSLSPSMVAKFAHAQTGGEPMVAWGRDPHKPWLFKVGNDFLGAVMPVRSNALTASVDDDWLAALQPAETETDDAKGKAA